MIARELESVIEMFGLRTKTIACFYYGGLNLRSCYRLLTGNVSYASVGHINPLTGHCLAHVICSYIGKALGPDGGGTVGAPFSSFGIVRTQIQKAFSWKKIWKGFSSI